VSGLQLTTAAEIAAALEGRREGRQWRCRCPIHGGRSLLVRDGDAGRILVFCHGGCEPRDVLAELRRSGLLGGSSKNYHLPPMRRNDRRDKAARTAWALAVWRDGRPAAGTIVESYLANRGLALLPSQYLRFHPACPHPSGASLPAMIGLVEHVNHGPTAIHRTFISAEGSGKAVSSPIRPALVPLPAALYDWPRCARANGCLSPKGWKRHSASCMPARCPGGQRCQQEGSKASYCHPPQIWS
jgi:putative DNA primase/helicase